MTPAGPLVAASDAFDGASLDPARWAVSKGDGAVFSVVGGGLTVSVDASFVDPMPTDFHLRPPDTIFGAPTTFTGTAYTGTPLNPPAAPGFHLLPADDDDLITVPLSESAGGVPFLFDRAA